MTLLGMRASRPLHFPVFTPPKCSNDGTQLQFQNLEIILKEKTSKYPTGKIIFPHPYCSHCRSYPTDQGMEKDPTKAAKDAYRINPHLGKPEDVVRAAPYG